jgi:hypothetical protein
VAARLLVDEHRVLTWIRSGRLRAIDVSEGSGAKARWRIMPEALDEFLVSREAVPLPKRNGRRAKSGWQFQYL